eukprot:NODE_4211_length_804_cov_49.347120_g4188_i0.p1 GENE.NODE_4211_length_804_cov_49.347120_g4188_i0~~NODE_4211_length_804_cov_49.347120_g4188_i0.p1  ORF type:complete len:237 (-),score=33.32 NODE_4211_length_804_cov_49.347120_g4188_i0:92-709(-)
MATNVLSKNTRPPPSNPASEESDTMLLHFRLPGSSQKCAVTVSKHSTVEAAAQACCSKHNASLDCAKASFISGGKTISGSSCVKDVLKHGDVLFAGQKPTPVDPPHVAAARQVLTKVQGQCDELQVQLTKFETIDVPSATPDTAEKIGRQGLGIGEQLMKLVLALDELSDLPADLKATRKAIVTQILRSQDQMDALQQRLADLRA